MSSVSSAVGALSIGYEIQGCFGDQAEGYRLIQGSIEVNNASALGIVHDPGSPLMLGVTTFAANTALGSPGAVVNGGQVVAEWSDRTALIVEGFVQGRYRVDLNFYPPRLLF